MLASHGDGAVSVVPLHAVAPKPFDWAVFARMHGTELPAPGAS
jgi:6-phosphofructokinase 1